jgi:hypothetical protein
MKIPMTPTMAAIAYAPTQAELNRLTISGMMEALPHKELPARAARLRGRLMRKHQFQSSVPKLASRLAEAEERRLARIARLEALRTRAH